MVTSVIELADKLFKGSYRITDDIDDVENAAECYILSKVCANANDIGLPLSVVQQLLKGTDYEQLLS